MTALKSPRAVADVTNGMILAMVEIAAPPDRVFQALTTAELASWWGSPDTYHVVTHMMEPRIGGQWRSEGQGRNGTFVVQGEILAWDPPHGFTQTWSYDWDPAGQTPTRIDWQLDAIEGGTRVSVRHSGFADAAACLVHTDGWELVLGWLNTHVAHAPLKAM